MKNVVSVVNNKKRMSLMQVDQDCLASWVQTAEFIDGQAESHRTSMGGCNFQ